MNFNKAKEFIYKNARPLDCARWQYLFENGNRENVLTQIIREVDLKEKEHPIILRILNYLENTKYFDGHVWANSIPSNEAYPYAPWWNYIF